MSARDIPETIPSGGFLKIGAPRPAPLPGDTRAALIRRGNELYNKGEFELAERIFVTTRYTDGLVRIGDRALRNGRHLEALRAYWNAPAPGKTGALVERMAGVVHFWLSEERTKTG